MWWTSFSLTAAGQSRIFTGFPFDSRAEARDTSTVGTFHATEQAVKPPGWRLRVDRFPQLKAPRYRYLRSTWHYNRARHFFRNIPPVGGTRSQSTTFRLTCPYVAVHCISCWCPGQFARARRESGENPGLPRSGKRERPRHMHWPLTGLGSGGQVQTISRFERRWALPAEASAGGSEPSEGSELDRHAREPEDLPASDAGEKSDDGLDLEASREAGRSVLAQVTIDRLIDRLIDRPIVRSSDRSSDRPIDGPRRSPTRFPPVFQ